MANRRGLLARVIGPEGRAERQALTAAAERATGEKADRYRRLVMPWQLQALTYYDTVGEAWYAAQFYARALSLVRLFVAKRDEQGELKEIEDVQDPAAQELDKVQDPSGGRSQLLASYGRLMFLIGDGYLTVTVNDLEQEVWEFLSPIELRVVPGEQEGKTRYVRYEAPSIPAEMLISPEDDAILPTEAYREATVWRLWRRHPMYSLWADSPMRAVSELFDELLLLQQAVKARAKSRLASSGILYVSQELSFGPADGEKSEANARDPFMVLLEKAMLTPISDPGAASSQVPLVVRGPASLAENDSWMKYLQIHDPNQTYPEENLRTECVRRIALGLDMPPELLVGMTDANHWTAWQIDDQTFKAHIQPICQMLCDDLTSAYLQPQLKEQGYDGWEDVVVSYDAAAVVNRPDRGKDAQKLYEQRVISANANREANGFSDDDAPTEDELAQWQSSDMLAAKVDPNEDETGAEDKTAPKGQAADETEEATDSGAVTASAAPVMVDVMLGASVMAFYRGREIAGNRIRNQLKGHETFGPIIQGVDSALVASAIHEVSNGTVVSMDARSLVSGCGRLVGAVPGVSPVLALEVGKRVEKHCAATLTEAEPDPFPKGLETFLRRSL